MSERVKLVALVRADPKLTRGEFEKRWTEGHAELALRLPRLRGYRINVAIEEFQEVEGELPFQGTAEMWWDSVEDMQADFATPEAEIAVADADEFTLERIHIITREHVLREGPEGS